jgi:hypothetical protein
MQSRASLYGKVMSWLAEFDDVVTALTKALDTICLESVITSRAFPHELRVARSSRASMIS